MIQSSRGTRWDWTCVIQVQREARSKDDPEFPRNKMRRNMCHTSPEGSEVQRWSWDPKEKLHYDPVPTPNPKVQNLKAIYQFVEFVACSPSQVQNPTFLSTIHGHGRECTKENGVRYSVQLFADCFRLRGKHGGVSRFYSVLSSPRRKEGMLHVASISQGAT